MDEKLYKVLQKFGVDKTDTKEVVIEKLNHQLRGRVDDITLAAILKKVEVSFEASESFENHTHNVSDTKMSTESSHASSNTTQGDGTTSKQVSSTQTNSGSSQTGMFDGVIDYYKNWTANGRLYQVIFGVIGILVVMFWFKHREIVSLASGQTSADVVNFKFLYFVSFLAVGFSLLDAISFPTKRIEVTRIALFVSSGLSLIAVYLFSMVFSETWIRTADTNGAVLRFFVFNVVYYINIFNLLLVGWHLYKKHKIVYTLENDQ